MTERRLIASGRTAEVYEWGDSQVLKLFRSGWARADVDREAQVAKAVAAAGLASAIHDLVRVADRDGGEQAQLLAAIDNLVRKKI